MVFGCFRGVFGVWGFGGFSCFLGIFGFFSCVIEAFVPFRGGFGVFGWFPGFRVSLVRGLCDFGACGVRFGVGFGFCRATCECVWVIRGCVSGVLRVLSLCWNLCYVLLGFWICGFFT